MKIRTNYVSNSSSSSFILKYKRGATIKLGSVEFTMRDLISIIGYEVLGCRDTFVKFDNKEEFKNSIVDAIYLSDMEKSTLDGLLRTFSDDDELLQISIDYQDKALLKLMHALEELGLFKIVAVDNE